MVAHPFHIHDVQFYIIERSGQPAGPEDQGRKDVVLIPSGDSVMFITKFEDFADDMMPYMYHCHILMHEDDGMMGQFIVKQSQADTKETFFEDEHVKIYPNPAVDNFNIKLKNFDLSAPIQIKIYDVLGALILDSPLIETQKTIETNNWESGIYSIELIQNQINTHNKIIIK
jgi:bilirubin oxidase